ncbi:hypothetical protein [Sphaerisporangium perillae]|uniref:hypothetical protein n=1 Tax=Sphaerisporangium perillae TaxID=2935860 RepID=UPI00200FBC9A|nr:hypothetical protein [Sphaerisporangium perillae]
MRSTTGRGPDRDTHGKGRARRAGATAVLLTTVALVAGACARSEQPGRTVASVAAGADSTSAATPAATGKGDPVVFAKCMRENGVPGFPDPKPGVGIPAALGNSPQFKTAEKQCKKYMPTPDEGVHGTGPQESWSSADKLKYAKCMRENGVPKFPDPGPDGGFAILEGSGADPTSPQFKKAEATCAKYQPQNLRNMTPNRQVPGGGS